MGRGYDLEEGKSPVQAGSRSPRHRVQDPYGCDYDLHPPRHGGGFMGERDGDRFEGRCPQFSFGSMGRFTPPNRRGFSGPGYGRTEPFHPEGQSLRINQNSMPRGGDWVCLEAKCEYMSIARRNQCNNCKKPRKRMVQKVTPRKGSWICLEPTCGFFNFPLRKICKKCSKPRKGMASFGMEVGGTPGRFQCPQTPPTFMGGSSMGRGAGRGTSDIGPPHGGRGRGGPGVYDRMSPLRPREQSLSPVRNFHRCHGDYHRDSYVDILRDGSRDRRSDGQHDG